MFWLQPVELRSAVVDCLTLDRGAENSSLTGVTALCPWARHINPSLVLVQPRKTCPFITERLLMGRKESNQTNKYSQAASCIKPANEKSRYVNDGNNSEIGSQYIHNSVWIISFLASGDFCRLLITFANSLDQDQDQQNLGSDLDPNHLTFPSNSVPESCKSWFWKESAENNKSMKN